MKRCETRPVDGLNSELLTLIATLLILTFEVSPALIHEACHPEKTKKQI